MKLPPVWFTRCLVTCWSKSYMQHKLYMYTIKATYLLLISSDPQRQYQNLRKAKERDIFQLCKSVWPLWISGPEETVDSSSHNLVSVEIPRDSVKHQPDSQMMSRWKSVRYSHCLCTHVCGTLSPASSVTPVM